ncbi:MAG: AAA family ATPase, partial [Propionibacteriaceae bacterium]|nr:AAA family ATPase [Propionibacteriaceae bacterium]
MADSRATPDSEGRFFPLVVAKYNDPSLEPENISPQTVEEAVRQAEALAAVFGHQSIVPIPPLEAAQTEKHLMLKRLSGPTVGQADAATPSSPPAGDANHDSTDAADLKIVFTYWLGHGRELPGKGPVLFVSDSRVTDEKTPLNIISPEDFAGYFSDQVKRPGVLPFLLLDACDGHQFIRRVSLIIKETLEHAAYDRDPPAGRDYILIAARSNQGVTFTGRTADNLLALMAADSDRAKKSAGRTISLNDVIEFPFALDNPIKIGSLADTAEGMELPLVFEYSRQRLMLTRTRPVPPPGMTVREQADWRSDIERLKREKPDAVQFFLPKGGWGERAGEPTWDFTGREAERGHIARWLEAGRDLLVVTGEPGAGKSALLGDVIMRSNPEILQAIVQEGLAETSDHDATLARHAPSATTNLVGRTAKDTAEQLGRQAFKKHWPQNNDPRPATADLGQPVGGADRLSKRETTVGQDSTAAGKVSDDPIKRLLALARGHGSPLSFVVDGLDESAEPYQLATELLTPLAALPEVAVIVGTRRSVHSRLNAEVADDGLLRALGAVTNSTVTDPTTPDQRQRQVLELSLSPGTMASYLKARLRRRLPAAPPDLIDQTVERMVAVAGQPFLYARLAASKIEAEKDTAAFMAAVNRDLPGVLGQDCATVFRRALDQLQDSAPASRFILQALALSQGRGLPEIDTIWSTAARALGAPVEVTPEATTELFKSHARDYLIGDLDHGQTVFRFAHRTFAEAVLDELGSAISAFVPDEAVAATPSDAESLKLTAGLDSAAVAKAHATIAAALTEAAWQRLNRAADRGESPEEVTLNPYISHYLPVHCSLAGGEPWAAVEAHAPILDHLDPTQVANAVIITRGFGSAPVQPQVAAVASHEQLMRALPSTRDRRRTRELLAYHFGIHHAPPRPAYLTDSLDYQVLWASLRQWSFRRRLDIGVQVNTVVSIQGLLALGCADGTIRLWDPATGQPWYQPLEGHHGPVGALAAASVDDRTLLASGGGDDRTIRLWDPATGQLWGQLEGHQGPVRALAAITANGRTLLASGGGDDRTIRLWDPATGQP